jgi:hypothetical protein
MTLAMPVNLFAFAEMIYWTELQNYTCSIISYVHLSITDTSDGSFSSRGMTLMTLMTLNLDTMQTSTRIVAWLHACTYIFRSS